MIGLLSFPIIFSYTVESSAGIGAYLMLFTTTMFLKLISFHHVYHDVRSLVKRVIAAKREGITLTPNKNQGTIYGVSKQVFDEASTYPKCLKASHFLRFMIAPTCCY